MTNLRADPAAGEVRDELRTRLNALEGCAGDACRIGPELALTLAVEGRCPGATVTVDVSGPDAAKIARVRFLIGRRVVETVRSAPFTLAEPLSSASAKLRAHVVLDDGRELTEDRLLPACR